MKTLRDHIQRYLLLKGKCLVVGYIHIDEEFPHPPPCECGEGWWGDFKRWIGYCACNQKTQVMQLDEFCKANNFKWKYSEPMGNVVFYRPPK